MNILPYLFIYALTGNELRSHIVHPLIAKTYLNMTATTHGIFILKHNLTFDCSLISWGCRMEALYGADLTLLVSARFIFPPSTGAWSALSPNPLVFSPIYQVHQCFM